AILNTARKSSRNAAPAMRLMVQLTKWGPVSVGSSGDERGSVTIFATLRRSSGAASPGRPRRWILSSPIRKRWCRRIACLSTVCPTRATAPTSSYTCCRYSSSCALLAPCFEAELWVGFRGDSLRRKYHEKTFTAVAGHHHGCVELWRRKRGRGHPYCSRRYQSRRAADDPSL